GIRGHGLAKAVDRPAEITAERLDALGAEDDQDDRQHDHQLRDTDSAKSHFPVLLLTCRFGHHPVAAQTALARMPERPRLTTLREALRPLRPWPAGASPGRSRARRAHTLAPPS